ncbi:GNAT family N-acetyltransferase [Streptomyces sp. N35]|uniref:GNAT family N-acetyltransferase n=1 Tax=Streptomyces sp. N35 TaxID=2795730 RepID=UPI0027DE988B|nr:GNAT family N-acetyltransferase [Streptomyces sp. N35]
MSNAMDQPGPVGEPSQDAPFALPTPDLTLVALAPAAALDLATGGTGGFTWIEGGPEQGTRIGAGLMAKAAADGAYVPGWGTYVLVREADGLAVGAMGFHSAPVEGRVEVGYDVAAAARRHGYATQALRALTTWALDSVPVVFARTDPGNEASQRVLVKAGFVRVPSAPDSPTYELRPVSS